MEINWVNYLRSLPNTQLLGDDAAIIGDWLITVDMLSEGVDFLLAETDPVLIGRKALAVNLSDIAAMGGIPQWIFVAVTLPKNGSRELAEKLLAGMKPLIEKYRLILAGGDTNTWDGGLVISVTVVGKAAPFGIFRRSGCQVKDKILVTGQLGGSIFEHQFLFEPRINEALFLNEHYAIHAAMDISDGFTLDLSRMLIESSTMQKKKCGAKLYELQIPVSADAVRLSNQTGKMPVEHALSDGEDFELLLAVPPDEAKKLIAQQPLRPFDATLYEVGEVTTDGKLYFVRSNGTMTELEAKGYEH